MFFQSAPCRSSLKKGTINVGHVVTSSVSQMILLLELKALCDVGFTLVTTVVKSLKLFGPDGRTRMNRAVRKQHWTTAPVCRSAGPAR